METGGTVTDVTTEAGLEQPGTEVRTGVFSIIKFVAFFPLLYLVFRLVSAFVASLLEKGVLTNNMGLAEEMFPVYMVCFFLFFFPGLYLFNCALAGRRLRLDWRSMVLYMGILLIAGITCEVGVDSLWVWLFGKPLWEYQIYPLHHGYTSGVAIVMWPMYGFYIYCLHCAIKQNPKLGILDNYLAKAALIGMDAMALEIMVNTFALALFQTYYFYYMPHDLNHFSSIQVFIPYVITGNIGLRILHRLDNSGRWRVPAGILLFAMGVFAMHFVI
ncbi:MAG: hypothetical protein ACLFOY_18095 [Desulfatibacillaceae bacterium]